MKRWRVKGCTLLINDAKLFTFAKHNVQSRMFRVQMLEVLTESYSNRCIFTRSEDLVKNVRFFLFYFSFPKMGHVQLVYFDMRGRAELPRLIMHAAGQPFDDIVTEDKSEFESSLLFGQLPLLMDGDVKIVQSGAIVRYLVKKLGMCGKSEQDALLCDQLYEGTEDIFKVLWTVCLTYRGGTREVLDKAKAEGGSIYKYLVRCCWCSFKCR